MTVKTLEDIDGCEFDWLGCDKSGQVALFSTGGAGYVPEVFLADTEVYDQAIDSILKLSVTTSAKDFPKIGEGLENTWRQVSERGIYGYDADFNSGDYRRVSIPNSPIFVDELPEKIAEVVKQFRFSDVLFGLTGGLTKLDISRSETNKLM